MQNFEAVLAEHHLFKDLDQRYIKLIAGCASFVRFRSGEVIFREGEDADIFYIIREGKVTLELTFVLGEKPTVIQTIGEGDVLGWSWIFPPYRWRLDARAVEHTEAIALDGKFLRAKSSEDQNLGYELTKRFSHIMEQRLQAIRKLQLLERHNKDYEL